MSPSSFPYPDSCALLQTKEKKGGKGRKALQQNWPTRSWNFTVAGIFHTFPPHSSKERAGGCQIPVLKCFVFIVMLVLIMGSMPSHVYIGIPVSDQSSCGHPDHRIMFSGFLPGYKYVLTIFHISTRMRELFFTTWCKFREEENFSGVIPGCSDQDLGDLRDYLVF